MENYYFPIDSMCLAHYFGHACIIPSKYLNNKPTDIQNRFEDYLLITTNKGTKETDCCLELILTHDEVKQLIEIGKGFYLFPKPLAISRVKFVIFLNKNVKEQIITNIVMSTAFIPENIIKVIATFNDQKTPILQDFQKNLPKIDWTEKIKLYDSLLGGFALLRLGGEEYMNYSENYFSTLAIFNSVIQNEIINSKKSFINLFSDELYIGLKSYLKKNIDEKDLYEIAKKERQTIVKNSIGVIDINKLNKSSYILAILNNYGVGAIRKAKNIDDLILTNFKNGIKPDKSELISLCYGINRGYSAFTNRYKHNDKEKIVKFELDSLLDYYTIESLYQYCINSIQKCNEFPYLDKLFTKTPDKKILNKTDYRIIDVIVKGKKKQKKNTMEIFLEKFQTIFQEYFGNKTWESAFNQFKKEDLLNFVNEINDDVIDELRSEIEEELHIKYQKEISKIKTDFEEEKNELLRLIRESDITQFDEVDVNRNGILESKKVTKFVDKSNKAKKIQTNETKFQEKNENIFEEEKKYKKEGEGLVPITGMENVDNFTEINNLEKNEFQNTDFQKAIYDDSNSNTIQESVNKSKVSLSLSIDEKVEDSIFENTQKTSKQLADPQITYQKKFEDYIEESLAIAIKYTVKTIETEFKNRGVKFEESKSIGELIIMLLNIPINDNNKIYFATLLTSYSLSPKDALKKIAKEKHVPYNKENDIDLFLKLLNRGVKGTKESEDYNNQEPSLF